MAQVAPFRGVRYNSAKFKNLDVVVSQPYDKINHTLQDEYYRLSDHNIVRIILGKTSPNDSAHNNQYTRARQFCESWQAEGILLQEAQPAVYVFHQTFSLPGGPQTRKAFIAALKLVEFDEGIVLPHERTLSGPKADRLNLMRAMAFDTELVFMLYPDSKNRINAMLDAAVAGRQPDMDVRELYESDVRQQLWAVTGEQTISTVVAEMGPKLQLIIADGHHRYETALNYRQEMRQRHPDAPDNAAFNYVMVAFVSMDDPGLAILPTHRLIHPYDRANSTEVLEKAKAYFNVTPQPTKETLDKEMAGETASERRLGFYDGAYFLLQLRDPAIMAEIAPDRVPEWRMLDVSILHELLIERILGLDKESVARQENIKYLREVEEGIAAVDQGKAQFLFILNPTRIQEVKACSERNEKMPQKSTDFYPKMISGLVMCAVGSDERL
ncbi:MAG: DUF1015 domain-containing protein [Chloroflexi bacterium]|nr:DUF1015 domain-containing protein [Chloroflexota bacterium]